MCTSPTGIAVVIPALNPTDTLLDLVDSLKTAVNDTIIVVNDGSTDPHSLIAFEKLRNFGCTVLTHTQNLGKGRALKTAFKWCSEYMGEETAGVITVDADGQHLPKDILRVREALLSNQNKLVLGCRNFSLSKVPLRSRVGNRSMSVLMRLFFGMDIEDTQTGLRGIPRAFACELVSVPGDGYEFEANMLLEARNHSIEVLQVPIDTVYENDNATSHFRPLMDSLRVCSVFIRYALSSCASSIVDLACFALFDFLLNLTGLRLEAVVLATYCARLVSALFNFTVNKHLVFKRERTNRSSLRYAILCIACVSVSAALVAAASWFFPFIPAVVAKIVVDTVLFFANYRIQESWVFRGKRSATVS